MGNYKVIVDGKRYDTSKMELLIDEQYTQGHSNGVTLCGVWKTKSGNVLVVTDSVWASGRNDGTCVGLTAHFAEPYEIAMLANRYADDGDKIYDLVPEGE
jgi:hypothetical protein